MSEVKKLRARRQEALKDAGDKIEERRRSKETRRKAKRRDPQSEVREEELDKKIRELHAEIEKIDKRLVELESRAQKLGGKIKKAVNAAKPKGRERAMRSARADEGITESPPGSNWGGKISRMILFTGYSGPVYWCGCAVCWWAVKKGQAKIPVKIRLGYAPFITEDAVAGRNGLKAVSFPGPGMIGTLWGGEHIVFIQSTAQAGVVNTTEGNTSAADGSQSNGGGCFPKQRLVSDFDVFAEVTW